MEMTATFSPCRAYRYQLWRIWDRSKPFALFVCLNPSIADETQDSRTSRRCIRFAQAWGYGSLCMANLFAYRSQDPKRILEVSDPVGVDNDRHLKDLAAKAGIVIAAWGWLGVHRGRDREVVAMLPGIHCLGTTRKGLPRHPLYVRKDAVPAPYAIE